MKTERVDFLWSKDVMADDEYWKKVVQIARNSTVQRIVRCSQIMGRKESEQLSAAQIFYPCMQCADIFHLKADITQLGMDQRKVNILAREVGPKLGFWKTDVTDAAERAIELKMSKSKPETAIFMTDTAEDVKRKIGKAYCPEKKVDENPIMEYYKHIVFEKFPAVEIKRPEKFGGNLNVESYGQLEKLYGEGKIHPMDLKGTAAEKLNELIEPVRLHFATNARAKNLLEQLRSFDVTR